MQQQPLGDHRCTSVICVDSYECRVPSGRLCSPPAVGHVFHGVIDLLLQLESALDCMHNPQSFTGRRQFRATPVKQQALPAQAGSLNEGLLATFAVQVMFRQNASWQGSVVWLEAKQEEHFRSALELLLLLDNALQHSPCTDRGPV